MDKTKRQDRRLELLTDARAMRAAARQPWISLNDSLARAIELIASVMEYLLEDKDEEEVR